MNRKEAANLVNLTAMALLLLASAVFHLQRALSIKDEGPTVLKVGFRFSRIEWRNALPTSFPAMLIANENFSHHKPNQHA